MTRTHSHRAELASGRIRLTEPIGTPTADPPVDLHHTGTGSTRREDSPSLNTRDNQIFQAPLTNCDRRLTTAHPLATRRHANPLQNRSLGRVRAARLGVDPARSVFAVRPTVKALDRLGGGISDSEIRAIEPVEQRHAKGRRGKRGCPGDKPAPPSPRDSRLHQSPPSDAIEPPPSPYRHYPSG